MKKHLQYRCTGDQVMKQDFGVAMCAIHRGWHPSQNPPLELLYPIAAAPITAAEFNLAVVFLLDHFPDEFELGAQSGSEHSAVVFGG